MLYTPTIMTNMDIVHYLYRRGNGIWVKLGIGSIWETGFYIGPLWLFQNCTYLTQFTRLRIDSIRRNSYIFTVT